ncbi:MAG: hypothetical protein K1V87_00695 [Muribaculum sp.]
MQSAALSITDGSVYEVPRTLQDRIVEPSPEVASFSRYTDFPVSYSTGTAQLNIPLAQWKSGPLDMSLSISYHTGGIKVDDVAGHVGLGSISRSIHSMPDESSTAKFSLNKNNFTLNYLLNLMEQRAEANHDRYRYNIPGRSGSFIIDNDMVYQLPETDLKIAIIANAADRKVIDSFTITTPEGLIYTFAAKETVEYTYNPNPVPIPYYSPDYTATSAWLLTKISDTENNESVTITYSDADSWTRTHDRRLYTTAYCWNNRATGSGFVPSGPSNIGSTAQSKFIDRKRPSKITSRTATVDFTTSGSQWGFTMKNHSGKVVRKVTFENFAKFSDERRRLDGVKIEVDGVTVDSHKFTYYSGTGNKGHSDAFGFVNNNISGGNDGILDRDGLPSAMRTYNFEGVRGLPLHTVENAAGVVTTFDYEPSIRPADTASSLKELKIGMRVKRITADDRSTGRKRIRDFTYEEPVPSAELSSLSLSAYIALAGLDKYSGGGGLLFEKSHTISATMTASSRLPGFPVENTVIYYRKVTESISGTGIERPIKTLYEFDPTHCIHQLARGGKGIGGSALESGWLRYLGGDGVPNNGTAADYERNSRLFSSKSVNMYFKEYMGEGPVLKRRTDYIWRNGDYAPHETADYYSSYNKKERVTGLYYESLVFKTEDIHMQTNHNIASLNDINYFNTSVTTSRMLCDSVITTRHFADGNTRQTIQRTIHQTGLKPLLRDTTLVPIRPLAYALDLEGGRSLTHPGFRCDSIVAPSGSWRPLSVSVSCLGETMALHRCDSEQVHTSTYTEARSRGLNRLPVADKWVNVEGDSIELLYHYKKFYTGLRTCFRRSVAVLRTTPDDIIERSVTTAYSSYGHPASLIMPDGVAMDYTWGYDGDCLTSKSIKSHDIKTEYTHIPLVGVTQIKSATGSKLDYSYTAGRLASEKNSSGLLLNSYTYNIYGVDGINKITVNKGGTGGTITTSRIYDGFGMTIRDIAHTGATTGQYMHSATLYDALDRPIVQYRPFSDSSADYIADSDVASATIAAYGDTRPFTSVTYDCLREDRQLAVITPGNAYNDHPARFDYLCNTSLTPLDCRRYRVNASRTTVTLEGLYPAGALDVVRSTDADGHVTLTFTDWRGNMVLRRTVMSSGNLDTYFIRDGWGNPLVVLQPEGSARFSAVGSTRFIDSDPVLKDYAFVYRYDKCLRPVYKRVPGCEAVTTAYDPYGRPAFMQDGNLRSQGRFMFMLYDGASRPVMTRLCSGSPSAVPAMTATYMGTASGIGGLGYSFSSASLTSAEPLTVNYYDTYSHTALAEFAVARGNSASYSGGKGLLTGTLSRVLSADTPSRQYTASIYSYDANDRLTRTSMSGLHDTRSAIINTTYVFGDEPVVDVVSVVGDGGNITGRHNYSYDKAGRPSSTSFTFNSLPSLDVMTWQYDDAGLVSKADYAGLPVDYTYTVSGAIKSVGSRQSQQAFKYHDGPSPSYNGNISAITVTPITTGVFSDMAYVYDDADRLVSAIGEEGVSLSNVKTTSAVCGYDKNSTITSLTRTGKTMSTGYAPDEFGTTDDLSLSYTGNRLKKVTDRADEVLFEASLDFHDGADNDEEYDYDANGNMVRDDNRGIVHIDYNVLNLPQTISFFSGDRLDYVYDASGVKLSVEYTPADVDGYSLTALPVAAVGADEPVPAGLYSIGTATQRRDYFAGCEWENGVFTRMNTPYGYHDGSAYYARIPDYQGNVMAVVKAGTDMATQSNYYYPYGLPTAMSSHPEVNRYKFGGKELETRHGLTLYDFEARWHDPQTARFLQPDPMAGDYPWLSPYTYCAGNPIRNIDPTGMDIWCLDEIGRIFERIKNINIDQIKLVDSTGADRLDAEGNSLEITFDYGVIESQRTISYGVDKYYDVYQVRGDDNATDFFEFVSNNISGSEACIEFGLIRTGLEGSDGLNFITTGHARGSEPGMSHLVEDQLRYSYTLRSITHSHPLGGKAGASDYDFVNNIYDKFKYVVPQFIYHVPTKKYIQFYGK